MDEKMGIKWWVWVMAQLVAYASLIGVIRKWRITQYVYEDSPKTHQIKMGTPTMGGAMMLIGFLMGAYLLNNPNLTTIWVIGVTTLFCIIGVIDDALSICNTKNKGLSARVKFFAQCGVAVGMVIIFGAFIRSIAWYEYALYVCILVGTVNATNLTDGVDGLLSMVMLASLAGVLVMVHRMWLYEDMQLVMIMMGVIACFLVWNWHPATIFMGDTGSLMLGGFLASICIASGQWVSLISFGAVYIIETVSVMLQVMVFKRFRQRLFLMTPLHHHFELLGFKEPVIVGGFFILQLAFSGLKLWG